MAVELYNKDKHTCLAFYDLVDDATDAAVQSNQFLIVDDGHGALIDPGGNITYNGLLMSMQRYVPSRDLDFILASHADPDIIASVNKWFVTSHCKVMISQLWTRFVPHFTTGRDISGRIVGIPDRGGDIPLGRGISRPCRRISCTPKEISSSTIRLRRSCLPATWVHRWFRTRSPPNRCGTSMPTSSTWSRFIGAT